MGKYIKTHVIDELVKSILEIPGKKIITLVACDDVFTIDVSDKGDFGYEDTHKLIFQVKLFKALRYGGGMTIREFLPIKTLRKMPHEKEMWIPEKNLYGVVLNNGKWQGLEAKVVQKCFETDEYTGAPISREPAIHYKDFPIAKNRR